MNGNASDEDINMINEWYKSFDDQDINVYTSEKETDIKERLLLKIDESINYKEDIFSEKNMYYKKRNIWYYVAASLITLIIGTGVIKFILTKDSLNASINNIELVVNDVKAPEFAKPILGLENNSIVLLENISNGTSIPLNNNGTILKVKDDEFVLEGSTMDNIVYNTLSVPRGSRVVSIRLHDGTKVWLNAESNLRFPINNTLQSEQKVYISGEAYFEVSKLKGRKFIVVTNNTTTEVLGTHFNVNTHADSIATKVSLLEGSIKVSNENKQRIISPGQEAIVNRTGSIEIRNKINEEEVLSWKNGYFNFDNEELKSIMKQIERWYDVDIEYKDSVHTLKFVGIIPRKENVSSILEILEMTGVVKFTVSASTNGRSGKITVRG